MNYTTERPLKVLTWHVHGSYLYYLLHTPHEFYIPVKSGRPRSYGGLPKGPSFKWPKNAHEIPAEDVSGIDLDVILFQSSSNYLFDQFEILTEEQRELPRLFLEHDPPRQSPTDTRHVVDDPSMTLVHVTHFNRLMWDNNRTPSTVIEHGVVTPPEVRYTGEVERGIVVVNNIASRGRRLGADIFRNIQKKVPLDLVGMNSRKAGGLGEIPHNELLQFVSRYRFFFNPIRYTSLGLAVCEAMMAGIPVIGLATTEMAAVIENGVSGTIDTDPEKLVNSMKRLLEDPQEAKRLGEGARKTALKRFAIERFAGDWDREIRKAAEYGRSQPALKDAAPDDTFTSVSKTFAHRTTVTTSQESIKNQDS